MLFFCTFQEIQKKLVKKNRHILKNKSLATSIYAHNNHFKALFRHFYDYSISDIPLAFLRLSRGFILNFKKKGRKMSFLELFFSYWWVLLFIPLPYFSYFIFNLYKIQKEKKNIREKRKKNHTCMNLLSH